MSHALLPTPRTPNSLRRLSQPCLAGFESRRSRFVPGLTALWLALLAATTGSLLAAPANSRAFYVATDGDDRADGTRPTRDRTHGPFATVARAVGAVRELKQRQGGRLDAPISVWIRGGSYVLTQPVVLTPDDSGTAAHPIRYRAYGNERPILSGGRRLANWTRATAGGRPLWTAQLSDVRAGRWDFRELWIDGQRRPRARHPNTGYLAVAELPGVKPDAPWDRGQDAFRFAPGDLRASPTIANAELRVMNRWVESHLPIVAVDETERVVRFAKRSVFKLDPGDLYYAENAIEWLDRPGEWCLDRASGTLSYAPMPGEDPARVEAIAPMLTQVLRLEGKPERGAFVEHVRFENLTFAHTQWYFPSGFDTGTDKVEIEPAPAAGVGGFAQAAIGVPGAVRGEGARACVFEGCRFVHVGTYGLELGRGCRANRVAGCEFGDLGAGGIKLGETVMRSRPDELARDNEIIDCDIHDGGRVFHSAIGVWIGQSPGSRVLHNHIHDFYYTGISAGWTWGYDAALATNTLVAFNHVHHIGRLANGDGPILSDMAGIYTLGLHTGSLIQSNFWHDVHGLRYGGWGIYFDEGTTGIRAEHNLVVRTTHGGFHQHYGKENLVRNNAFVDARDFQIQRSRAEDHLSFTFERNVVAWRRGKLLEGNLAGTNYLFRQNLYWPGAAAPIRFDQWSWDQWRQRGQDAGSLLADPRFRNPGRDDYRLRSDSPALLLGFQPLDLRQVGVRPARR